MGNASQINRSQDSVRVERRSDLNESDLGEVYCIISVMYVIVWIYDAMYCKHDSCTKILKLKTDSNEFVELERNYTNNY